MVSARLIQSKLFVLCWHQFMIFFQVFDDFDDARKYSYTPQKKKAAAAAAAIASGAAEPDEKTLEKQRRAEEREKAKQVPTHQSQVTISRFEF
jgi:hypothetical protein